MRLGLIARADNSGLGIQTHEFYSHMKPSKTMVVDISHLNSNAIFPERYPDAIIIKGFPEASDIDNFLRDLDVVFVAESPYNYYLYSRAKQLGVKIAVQYNYEFFDWFAYPDYPTPDLLIAPSQWHYIDVEAWARVRNIKHIYLHCPVNREKLKFRTIRQARTFLHIAGRSAAYDRNGTKTVIEASKLLKTDANIIIHFQGEQGLAHQTTMTTADYEAYAQEHGDLDKLTIVKREFPDYSKVYALGDVLIMPRRYGGNCLPLNEALSVGMPAIMTNISPNNDFLPKHWLVPAEKINQFQPRTVIDIYNADTAHIARRIDHLYEMDEAEFMEQNISASNIAESISWYNMEWRYRRAFEELCS